MSQPCLLDLDGTLMPSHTVDNACYWAAVDDVLGGVPETLELTGFPIVTDDGILAEWCRREGHALGEDEVTAIRARFLERIETASTEQPEAFTAFAGVREWLANRPKGSVAVATGGWGHTARFKLARAGLDHLDLPLASSDDGQSREDIMRAAQSLLGPAWRSEKPVYFGDGAWDLAASRALAWDFVGIATGERAERLIEAGAEVVVPDFANPEALP